MSNWQFPHVKRAMEVFGPLPWTCHFCGKQVKRRNGPRRDGAAVHHKNRNRSDNRKEILFLVIMVVMTDTMLSVERQVLDYGNNYLKLKRRLGQMGVIKIDVARIQMQR